MSSLDPAPLHGSDPAPRDATRDIAARGIAVPPGVALFVATTFASAFLIFLVQPIVAKRILPWFGGVPSVWSLCLAFYQTTLFAGYAYAHGLIARAGARTQLWIHGAVVAAAVLVLPVLPGDAWKPTGTGDPSAQILAMLLANVALPFFALAATGPLVAVWFSRRYPTRSPYPLYAVSNLGSLVALLAYPFAIEPRLPLSTTGQVWSGAFAATGTAVVACAALARRTQLAAAIDAATGGRSRLRPVEVALWVLLSGCAVVMLMSVTNHLCLDAASVPFLWIAPLAIYLATLIVCFGAPNVYRRIPFVVLALLAYATEDIWALTPGTGKFGAALAAAMGGDLPFEIVRFSVLLFAMCMLLHGELYRMRPPPESLTAYYLCTSGGGALGGLAVGLVAPRVFDNFYELPIGLALTCVLVLVAIRHSPGGLFGRGTPGWRFAVFFAVVCLAIGYRGSDMFVRPGNELHRERSFFGVIRVVDRAQAALPHLALMHGSTLHGVQIKANEDKATTYYGIHTGIEVALGLRAEGVPTEVGVVGLGTGTLAAYGRPEDHFRFFEIDPAVISLSREAKLFTFVARSKAAIDIIQGDGRIALAREFARNAPPFDYLIVDAYSSDAVPVHLLTREAIALYLESLKPDGVLAIHTSSRYFQLMGVLGRLAQDAKVPAVSLFNPQAPRHLSNASTWVFFSKSEAKIQEIAKAAEKRHRARGLRRGKPVTWLTPEFVADAPLWTDDYSNLFRVLK